MPFEFKPERLNNKLSKLETIINYKPNFVLVSKNPNRGKNITDFTQPTDVNSVYKTSNKRVVKNLIPHILRAAISVSNIFIQVYNFGIYQSYRLLSATLSVLIQVPIFTTKVVNNIRDFGQTMSFSDTRELWWLERKIDYRTALKKFQAISTLSLRVIQKFYLTFVVVTALIILNSGGTSFLTNSSSSFVSKFIKNHSSLKPNSVPPLFNANTINASAVQLESKKPIISIVEHTVTKEDSLPILSNKYDITIDTIKFNNDLSGEDLEVGSRLYVPWIDGYIYRTDSNTTPENISKIYSIDQSEITKENLAILNPETNEFAEDSLVLIPTADFAKITEVNDKIASEKKAAEVAAASSARRNLLASQSISSVAQTAPTPAAANAGFIWPTSGIITRCVQTGHVACDIANAAAPDVVSVQSGTVSAVYRYTVYGYGLAVVVDHGNGLQTLYAHFSDIYVNAGQSVSQGQALGRMGCTGNCTGTHLHFEVRNNSGTKLNPLLYLP